MKKVLTILLILVLSVCTSSAADYDNSNTRTGAQVDNAIEAGLSGGAATGILKSDGAYALSAATDGTDYISSLAADVTPQLGGFLDLNNKLVVDAANAFGAADTNPDVTGGVIFKTGGADTYTDFDDGTDHTNLKDGQLMIILFQHAAGLDCTSSQINCNSGNDWTASDGDSAICTFDDTTDADGQWLCIISASAPATWAELPALTATYIVVGNAGNAAAAVEMTGDVTISNAGVTAIAVDTIGPNELADSDFDHFTTSGGAATVVEFALDAASDAGDVDITSIDKLEGFDNAIYIDLGADTLAEIVADGRVDITSAEIRLEVDALAYLSIVTADGGATTISQTSDGTDQIVIGDGSDRVDISSNTWDVTNGVISASAGANITMADGQFIDLTGIIYADTSNEGIALPTYVAGKNPADNKPYVAYDAANNAIMVYEAGGWTDTSSGTGAATNLNFITTSSEGSLSHESVLTAGNLIDVNDIGGDGGAVTVAVNLTKSDDIIWDDGDGSTWTFNTAANDPTFIYDSGTLALAAATSITHTTPLNILTGSDVTIRLDESDGTDWEIRVDDTGNTLEIGSSAGGVGDNVELEIDEDGDIHVTGDIYITGDGIFATTNTSGAIWVGDNTNYNPVVMSGDATIGTDGVLAIAADAVALSTDTTGNYVATIADAGNSNITVANSGSEGAAITLDVVDLTCTDCINATEIEDIYVLVAGDTMSGNLVLDDNTTDSPTVSLVDSDEATLTFTKLQAGGSSIVDSDGTIQIQASGDTGDYLTISTAGDIITIGTVGGTDGDLVISAAGGDISFSNENLITTGTLISGKHTLTGVLDLLSSNADPDAEGELLHDSTITGMSGGGLRWYDSGALGVRLLVDLDTDPSDDDYVVAYDVDADKFYMKPDANSGGATAWDDIIDPDANDEIDFGSYTIELNVSDFQIGDGGGANIVKFDGSGAIFYDEMTLDFGSSSEWQIEYDDGVDDQLLLYTTKTGTAATTDPMFEILVGTTPTADQQVFGIAKGTQSSNTALFTVDEDGDVEITGDLVVTGGETTIGSGGDPADQAAGINLVNTAPIAWEANPTGTDVVGISVDASEIVQIASSGASGVTITPATTITGALTLSSTLTDGTMTLDGTGGLSGISTIAMTGALSGLTTAVAGTSIEAPFFIVGSAATAADEGGIRLPNASYIFAEADEAGTDISVIGVDSGELVQIAASGSSGVVITPNTTITGDLTITGLDITADGTEEVISLVDVATAVNELSISNSATGTGADNQVSLIPTGGDAVIGMLLDTKAGGTLTLGTADSLIDIKSTTLNVTAGAVSGVTTLGASGVVTLSNTTEASAIGTAALTSAGGIGVAFDAWIGDDLVLDSDGAIISLGADQDVTITHTADVGIAVNLNLSAATYGSDGTVSNAELLNIGTIGASTISANQWAALGGIAETLTSGELDILDGVTATATELNYLDIATPGTGVASKAVVLDGSGNYAAPAGTWDFTSVTGLTFGAQPITTTGAFTSPGIDDNADATAITIAVTTEEVTFSAGVTITGDITAITGNDLMIGTADTGGVKLSSDGDGALTILGSGAGNDESLIINLDDTSDEITLSSGSGATSMNFSALNLVTTGSVQGGIKINTDADGMSQAEMTAVGMYGSMFFAGGAATWLLPDAVEGMSFCVYSTTAAAIVLNPDDNDDITLDGTLLANGDSVTSASGAGDFICMVAQSNTHWFTLGRTGTWTDTN